MPMFSITYHCDACDTGWEGAWSCACDDECPSCGRSIEPDDWEEIEQ